MTSQRLYDEVGEHLPYMNILQCKTIEEAFEKSATTLMLRDIGFDEGKLNRKGKKCLQKALNVIDYEVRTGHSVHDKTQIRERLRLKLEAKAKQLTYPLQFV